MENKVDYLIVKGIANNEELEGYRECFEKNGSERDIRNLQWLHQQNLTGTHTIYYAMQEQAVAAIYTAMPVIFTINGQRVNALQSIDTITDVAHRGKGLFPKLANKLYDDASSSYDLVYGFPNQNSAPGFFKKLQWVSFGEAPFLLKPLRLKYFLDKVLKKKTAVQMPDSNHAYPLSAETVLKKGKIVIKALDSFGREYDELWNRVSTHVTVGVDRSAAYLNWRYVTKPGEVYSKCGLYIDDALTGVVVFTIKNKHSGRIGYTMELIYEQAPGIDAGVALLKFATRIFKKEKTDAVLAWCFGHSFNYPAYKKAGYFNLPEKLRPQQLFLGVRAFADAKKPVIENKANWYISYSDSDTV